MSQLTPPSPRKRPLPPSAFVTPERPRMSRLPTLATPGRVTPTTGIPTPTHRRPRSSLGPGQSGPAQNNDGAEMDLALKEALKNRPPSSLTRRRDLLDVEDPDSPTQVSQLSASTLGPRTPGLRPRTPSAIGHGTPSASRAVSRSSVARPSISGTSSFTPRRTSMASSVASATPHARRPESRASVVNGDDKWMPVIGERVRMQAMGMEGTLRFLGETDFKAGVWAGIELEGGFSGKGKNDGSVGGVPYFSCSPLCGVFVLASKLSPPTSGPSRPASVASSYRSLASSHASFTLSGRQTPSERPRPSTTLTPGRTTRAVSSARTPMPNHTEESDGRPVRTLLGASTSANAATPTSKITAGSRASKYVGMTAKQLDSARQGTLSASVRGLGSSTSVTPKPSRVSMGVPTTNTPGRPRQSIAGGNLGGFATPKPRVPRASTAVDMMPPPPSPSHVTRIMAVHTKEMEDEIKELRRRNADLEAELSTSHSAARSLNTSYTAQGDEEKQRLEALQAEVERIREEADSLRQQLSASQSDAADASRLAEELQEGHQSAQSALAEKEKELETLHREMKLEAERMQGELDAGMEAKKAEVEHMLDRAERAEEDGAEMRALVEELTQAGQATISLYETKQYDLEDKIRVLEEKSRSLEDKLTKARDDLEKAQLPGSPQSAREATAAEIDNETLNAQLKHLQHKMSNLEEELDEARVQADQEAESWKSRLAKAKESEKAVMDRERELKEEVKRLNKAGDGAKARIAELEGALKENRGALETARAEIESLRAEASDASSMKAALQTATAKEEALTQAQSELEQMKLKAVHFVEVEARFESVQSRNVELEKTIATLELEVTELKAAVAEANVHRPSSPANLGSSGRKGRLSSSSLNEENSDKRLRGFQHIITELSTENAELKEKYQSVLEEVALLKEEVKLLEETNEMDGDERPKVSAAELVEAKATVQAHAQTIKELNREVSELESLIESKIYREDELENRLADLERQIKLQRHLSNGDGHVNGDAPPAMSSRASEASVQSRSVSGGESNSTSDDRCELCEGPHDLDACPVFAGNMGDETMGDKPSPLTGKSAQWCADCESTEHDTSQCPMAEDVF